MWCVTCCLCYCSKFTFLPQKWTVMGLLSKSTSRWEVNTPDPNPSVASVSDTMLFFSGLLCNVDVISWLNNISTSLHKNYCVVVACGYKFKLDNWLSLSGNNTRHWLIHLNCNKPKIKYGMLKYDLIFNKNTFIPRFSTVFNYPWRDLMQ